MPKFLKCGADLFMCFFIFALLYAAPLVLATYMIVRRYSFTLQQAGIIISIFTVVPGIVKILVILCGLRTEGNQCITGLGNWFGRHGRKDIAEWFGNNQYCLERHFNASIIGIALLAFFVGLVMQLKAI